MSGALVMHEKISVAEAVLWIERVTETFAPADQDKDLQQVITDTKPVDFKPPRKPRTDKKSSADRADSEYECGLCDARVWNDNLGAQCSRKKKDGECLCTIHIKESDKNGGLLRNGLFTEDRPTHAYGDETNQLLIWHDVEAPKKAAKKTSGKKGARKCGCCGETGHNKTTCPKVKGDDGTGTGLASQTTETITTSEFNGARQALNKAIAADEIPLISASFSDPEPEPEPETETLELEPEPEPETVVTVTEPEPEPEPETVVTEPEPEPEPEPELEPLLPAGEVKLDEDLSMDSDEEGSTILFEGISYNLDTEDNTVHDDELTELGNWDGSKVSWHNGTFERLHRFAKIELSDKNK